MVYTSHLDLINEHRFSLPWWKSTANLRALIWCEQTNYFVRRARIGRITMKPKA